METKRLYKSDDKALCGVCGGLAEFFDLDPVMVRIGYAALSIFSAGFPGLLLYIMMAIIMPKKTSEYAVYQK